jgi:hypothetical protein
MPVSDEKQLNENENPSDAEQAPEAKAAPEQMPASDSTLESKPPAATALAAKPDAETALAPKPAETNMNETVSESIQTSMLSLPDDALPMEQRDPRPNTAHLSLGWRIVFKIGDQKKTLPMKDMIMIGRAVESDSTANQINLDLTAFGAYHFGVSRNHAQMSLKDGYLYLEDLDSTNGTRINGFQLTANQKYRLRDGDEIEFARLRTVIQFKGPDTP